MALVVNPAVVRQQSRELGRLLPRAVKSGVIHTVDLRGHWVAPVEGETDQEFLYRLSWRYQKLAGRYDATPLERRPPEFWALAICYAQHHRRLLRRFGIWIALGILLGTTLGLGGGPLGVVVLSVVGAIAGIVIGRRKTSPQRPRQELAGRLTAEGDGDIFTPGTP